MIDAASRLLWRQGLHATGLNEILKESRAPRGSLYFHFPGGKEELATEAVVLAGNGITKGLAEIFDRHASLDEALAGFGCVGRDPHPVGNRGRTALEPSAAQHSTAAFGDRPTHPPRADDRSHRQMTADREPRRSAMTHQSECQRHAS